MSYAEWQDRYVDKDSERGIINKKILNSQDGVMYKYIEGMSFNKLDIPQNMEEVRKIASKYGLDITKHTILLKMEKELINRDVTGGAFPNGEIDLYPLAFLSEEALARTLYHETYHQEQYVKYRVDEVHKNYFEYENETIEAENKRWEEVKKK